MSLAKKVSESLRKFTEAATLIEIKVTLGSNIPEPTSDQIDDFINYQGVVTIESFKISGKTIYFKCNLSNIPATEASRLQKLLQAEWKEFTSNFEECKKTVSEAKFDDGEVDDIYGMLPAVADEVLSQIGLKQYKISASEGKLDTAYQSKGTLYLNIPVDLKTIGPMSAIISKLTLSFQLQKLDKVGPKDEVYWCPIDFKYEHPDGGSNGHQIATVWLTADGDVVGIRKVGK